MTTILAVNQVATTLHAAYLTDKSEAELASAVTSSVAIMQLTASRIECEYALVTHK